MGWWVTGDRRQRDGGMVIMHRVWKKRAGGGISGKGSRLHQSSIMRISYIGRSPQVGNNSTGLAESKLHGRCGTPTIGAIGKVDRESGELAAAAAAQVGGG